MTPYIVIAVAVALLIMVSWIYGKTRWGITKIKPSFLIWFATICILAVVLALQYWESYDLADFFATIRNDLRGMPLLIAFFTGLVLLSAAFWIYGKTRWDITKTKPSALILFAIAFLLAAGLAWQYRENRNRAEIIEILRAGITDDAHSQYRLGLAFEGGSKYLKRNVVRASEFYRRAAEQGYAPAQYRIGVFYEIGRGVIKRFSTALEWYQKAAAQNHREALRIIGGFYIEGKGMPADKTKGKALLTKAAHLGDPLAFPSLIVLAMNEREQSPGERRIELYKLSVLAKRAGTRRVFLFLSVRDEMTQQEITEAEKRIRAWERVSKMP